MSGFIATVGILVAPMKFLHRKFTTKKGSEQPGEAKQIEASAPGGEGAPQFSEQLAQLGQQMAQQMNQQNAQLREQNERLIQQMSALHVSISTRETANGQGA